MQRESREATLAMMEAAGQVIARFWHWAEGQEARIGFHPSIRNFATRGDEAVFFDTFPPLIHYSRDEIGRMLLQFSTRRPKPWSGWWAPLAACARSTRAPISTGAATSSGAR